MNIFVLKRDRNRGLSNFKENQDVSEQFNLSRPTATNKRFKRSYWPRCPPGPVVVRPRLFDVRTEALHGSNHCLRGIAGRALGFHRGSVLGPTRACRRPQHPARLSRSNRSVVDRAVSCWRHSDAAQLLDRDRSHDVPDANGYVYEEPFNARWRAGHLAVGIRTMESGLAPKVSAERSD